MKSEEGLPQTCDLLNHREETGLVICMLLEDYFLAGVYPRSRAWGISPVHQQSEVNQTCGHRLGTWLCVLFLATIVLK
jgi:hypothetical protein